MKRYLGIDVGGTKTKYGVYDESGRKIDSGIVDTQRDSIENFISKIEYIKSKYENLEGLGLSIPCVVNPQSGIVLEEGIISSLKNINIKKLFEDRLNIKVSVENDANCVALAEKWKGNGKDISDFICITIGTGIGGAIVINDKIYRGKNFVAGEFGFMDIKYDCNIENDFGHLASTAKLVDMVYEIEEYRKDKVDGYYIFNKLSDFDPKIIEVYNEWISNLARGIKNLCFILDPEKILIGGGVSAQEKVIADLNTKLNELVPKEYRLWSIDTCKYFNDSGVIGAIYNFIQNQ